MQYLIKLEMTSVVGTADFTKNNITSAEILECMFVCNNTMFTAFDTILLNVVGNLGEKSLLPYDRVSSPALLFVSKSPFVSLLHGKLPNDELPGIKHF